jgi:tetratricopeptide (TPR) repeat protein
MDVPLSQLSVLEESGRLLVRLEDGRLAEPSGQLQLEFPESSLGEALSLPATMRSADDWFREAVASEDAGDFAGAAAAYEQAIDQEPDDPILHFNLGNVLYATDRLPTAAEHFRRAVDLDSEYVEAWNNLATVLADLGQIEASITALGRALAVFPLYADAHFNLGDVLASAGRTEDARRHWRQYLQLDPKSPWAEDVKRRLASLQTGAGTAL